MRNRSQAGRRPHGDASADTAGVRDDDARNDCHWVVAEASATDSERGQTTLDFAVGMGLFIISLIFVLVFVPGLLDPFTAGTQDETPAVNRVADQLSQQLLSNSSEPYVLDRHCTMEFFEDDAVSSDCPFSGSTVEERVGVRDYQNVNVTIESNVTGSPRSAILCWDTDPDPARLGETGTTDCGSSEMRFAIGPSPSGAGSRTVSAQRVVVLTGEDVTIQVEMW